MLSRARLRTGEALGRTAGSVAATTMGSSEGRRRGLTVVPTECRKIVSARPPMNFPFYLTINIALNVLISGC